MECRFAKKNGRWECVACGKWSPYVSRAAPRSLCRPGLGDRVASALSAVGITEARVQAVASAVGVRNCGCKRRREALNAVSRKLGLGG